VSDPRLQRLERAVEQIAAATRDRPSTGVRHDDAPEDTGTIGTDDAVGFDPFPLLRALHRSGVVAVVMGQVAGILHGSTELTGDLDLLWGGGADQAGRLAQAFTSLDATLTDAAGAALLPTAAALDISKINFRTPTACGDCCTPGLPWGSVPVADYLADHDLVTRADGTVIRFVRRDALIAMRLAVGRTKDLRRAAELAATDFGPRRG